MRSVRRAWSGLLLVAAAAAWVTPAPADDVAQGSTGVAVETGAEASPTLSIRDVRVEQTGAGRRVIVALSRAPESMRSFSMDSPPRLVMEVSGPLARTDGREQRFPVDDPVVAKVRAAEYKKRLRIVVDLHDAAPVRTARVEGAGLIAELSDAVATSPASADTLAAATPAVPPPAWSADAPSAAEAVAMEPTPAAPTTVAAAESPAPPPAAEAPPPAPVAVAKVETPEPAKVETPELAKVETPEPVGAEAAPAETPAVARPAPALAERPLLLATATTPPVAARPAVARRQKTAPMVPGQFAGERISLDFKDADIQNVLRVLADVSNMNIIATDDVKGKVTLHLAEVPWDQALDLVLRTNRLEASQEGNVVRISTVARLKEERQALRAAEDAQTELEPLRIAYERVNYARADEAFIDKVKGVLTDRGSVTFDDRTNTIIIRDIQAGIGDAEHLIRELDVQSPQVLIEANIVEATEDFARGLGVQWGYRYSGGPQTGTPTGVNFPGSIGVGGSGLGVGLAPGTGTGAGPAATAVPFLADFPVPSGFGSGFGPGAGSALDLALGSLDGSSTLVARLTALEEEGKGKVISRPRVITMNNVAATIQSLTILRVKLPSTGTVINTGTGGAAGTASTATEKINTGITLVVTPQVSADGFVLMNIYAKSSLPDFSRTVEGIPTEIAREANSNVLIKNGETVVLGGIFRHTADDRESGIPFLRSIPALGWLFKRSLENNRQEELLVFLTPKIVDPGSAGLPPADRLWQERSKGG